MTALHPLRDEQARAVAPLDNVWVSASAGTGKTQVLTARVLRLLLGGARPDAILCLTFTRAAAAEMQGRILARLAHWARTGDEALAADLAALCPPAEPLPSATRARALFAHVLETAGGLRVSTLHAFAQSLLASFPLEAGLTPGFATLDDRSALALRERVLSNAIDEAAAAGDATFAEDLAEISIASGEARLDKATSVLLRHGEAIAALGAPAGIEPSLRRVFGAPTEGSAKFLLAAGIERLDRAELLAFANHCRGDAGKDALKRADRLHAWLELDETERIGRFDELCAVFHNKKGERRSALVPGGKRADPDMISRCDALCEAIDKVVGEQRSLTAAAIAARHLRVGARLAGAHALAKRRLGVIDYDDMVARAAALLRTAEMGDWVRFKLDQRIDHLLIDEAQDTSAPQWDIAEAIAEEFFSGEGARGDLQRTLFVVGDFKQAIMSFQGADPRIFDAKQQSFEQLITDARRPWVEAKLTESFRSTPAVLTVVDAVVEKLGYQELGLRDRPLPHGAARHDAAGAVTLWPPLGAEPDDAEDDGDGLTEESGWLAPGDVRMANDLARRIAGWLDPASALQLPARARAVRPEDILVLVRSRGEFVGALVGALHAHGVPVAGADRMRLAQPLAVQDLLSLIRFVLQPNDDLTLATLLVSPLLGLDQQQLFDLAHGRETGLWRRLRGAAEPYASAAVEWLQAALDLADFAPPYEFLETMLSVHHGRHRLLARLGSEAADAIDALLTQALLFEAANAPSLEGFLAWAIAEDIDVKRDPEAPVDAVRIMTAHGAKGLQAPVVILADATRKLASDQDGYVRYDIAGNGQPVPVFYGGKAGRVGKIAGEADRADAERREEHWRLLYVALTRAEDLLFIGGPLPAPRGDKPAQPPPDSWYCRISEVFDELPGVVAGDDGERVFRSGVPGRAVAEAPRAAPLPVSLPDWIRRPAPDEPRPPRPLRPSTTGDDEPGIGPADERLRAAARRGQLMHALFERLPALDPAARGAAAEAWLARQARELAPEARGDIAGPVLAVLADPRFADLFGADALAEAPLAAVVGEAVIAGTVDRLLVGPDTVTLIDFKTGRSAPANAAAVPPSHLRQMAAYAAALERIFPGRRIRAALLYTETASLIELTAEQLVAHHPSRVGH